MSSYEDCDDARIRHLELIQAVIGRLGNNGFLMKGCYCCSSCMQAFIAEDAGRGKVPERCPQGHSALDARQPGAMAGGGRDPHAIEVGVGEGGERIRVSRTRSGLLLTIGDRSEQRLTLEEAWRLAEAIDELASGPEPS